MKRVIIKWEIYVDEECNWESPEPKDKWGDRITMTSLPDNFDSSNPLFKKALQLLEIQIRETLDIEILKVKEKIT